MARLTKKDYDGMLFWYRNKGGWRMEEIDKLGRYEDVDPRPNYLRKMKKEYLKYKELEEELGIDLRVYHKLMSMLYCGDENKLYVKDKDTIVEVGVLEIDYCKKKLIFYKDKNYNDDYVYGFWQYGKSWAFTKEELQ